MQAQGIGPNLCLELVCNDTMEINDSDVLLDKERRPAFDIQPNSTNAYPSAIHNVSNDSSLAYHNIVYTVPTGWVWRRRDKVILNSVR